MELKSVRLEIPEEANIIVGQSHFIKTVEDLYEVMVGSVPGVKFGLAFCEASMECLVRTDGNDPELIDAAVKNALAVGAGHTFYLIMKDAYPINVLNAVKRCQEVCSIYCATANPVEVITAVSEQGAGILGVIDGFSPKGVENDENKEARKSLLQAIGYKR
ncbi:adenosine-specific kinase [Desulfatibacillum aliphaticivorans]|uniref:adenosine-specific kinase n=1 Tax=Desulfatibacillum aliphaticivorans TaxID=218208 RepID=UPI00041B0E3D|nr:adenosine-specific kinase [Desulfatibacillum aliphaticivorans]